MPLEDRIYSVSEMPNMKKEIGRYTREKFEYIHNPEPVKRGVNITNTVIYEMQGRSIGDSFCEINDVIAGVSRLDHYRTSTRNIPLSQMRLYNILQCMVVINTREIQKMTGLSSSQARVYLRACRIIIPFLERYFKNKNEFLDPDEIGIDFDSWSF